MIAGQGLISTQDPKAVGLGYLLIAPESIINIYKGSKEIAKGNIGEGVQYLGTSSI